MNLYSGTNPDLHNLVDLFFSDPLVLGSFHEIEKSQVPQPYSRLLNHQAHMTVTLEQHHQCPVELDVLSTHNTESHYSRKIQLRRKSDNKVVLYGIVRLTLSVLPENVQQLINEETTPLGRILIEHEVLRTVRLLSLWEIEPGKELQQIFDVDQQTRIYGRTALIYCNAVPAIELMEIVAE